ncbi:MAG TPA: hypothetical protein VLE43_09170 [Candidatus Saccharimonadia bacterium]|nr:hypothetical protein [Candidatus Saccharimonadia bacterium]
MKKRTFNTREKRLLIICLSTIFLVGNAMAVREFLSRRKELVISLDTMKKQETANNMLLMDGPRMEKLDGWLDKHMPYTNSAGKAQGQLLDDLRNSALDLGLKTENENPLESLELSHHNEVSVSLRVRGDQEVVTSWLLTLQSPEKFTAIKSVELELDTRSREKTPQAQCNITVARWFNPKPPPGYQEAVPAPASVPAENVNPLELTTPLDGLVPLSPS